MSDRRTAVKVRRITSLRVPGTFQDWLGLVEESVEDAAGCGTAVLPDFDYRAAWEGGWSPRRAAEAAIRAAVE